METPHAAAYRFLYDGDHETILYAVMKQLHIWPNRADYEDYLQEARLLFPEIYVAFPENPEEKPHQFLAYAQQKLYWALLDKLRQERKRVDRQLPGDQEELLTAVASDDDILDAIGQSDFRQYLLKLVGGAGKTGEWRFWWARWSTNSRPMKLPNATGSAAIPFISGGGRCFAD